MAAQEASPVVNVDTDLDQAIQRVTAATADFINGNTETWKAMCSQTDDATLFGGWGGWEVGWERIGPRYDWAAARFAGGQVRFDELARYVTQDLACTVHLEWMQAQLAGGNETVPVNLRVTHVYRREADGWKLLSRHADPLTTIQTPESVVDQATPEN